MATATTINDVDIEAVVGLAQRIQQEPEVAATQWRADVTWHEGFRSSARIRDFAPVVSDEPEGLGGRDNAPNPVEQLLAALGNCLAVGYQQVVSTSPVGHTLRGTVPVSVEFQ